MMNGESIITGDTHRMRHPIDCGHTYLCHGRVVKHCTNMHEEGTELERPKSGTLSAGFK